MSHVACLWNDVVATSLPAVLCDVTGPCMSGVHTLHMHVTPPCCMRRPFANTRHAGLQLQRPDKMVLDGVSWAWVAQQVGTRAPHSCRSTWLVFTAT
jgi:hypothetical protein